MDGSSFSKKTRNWPKKNYWRQQFINKNLTWPKKWRQQFFRQKTYLTKKMDGSSILNRKRTWPNKNFWRQQFIKQTGSIDVSWRKTSEGSNLSNRKTYLTGKNGRQHFLEKNAYLAEKNYWRQQFIKNNSLLGLKHLKTAVYPPKNVFDQKKLEGRSFSTRTRPWPKKI